MFLSRIAVFCLLASILGAPTVASAQIEESAPLPDDIMVLVQEIQASIEEIRGQPFKTPSRPTTRPSRIRRLSGQGAASQIPKTWR